MQYNIVDQLVAVSILHRLASPLPHYKKTMDPDALITLISAHYGYKWEGKTQVQKVLFKP